jgi:hypothetical protein
MTLNVGGVWPLCNAANGRSCQDRFSGRIFRTVHLP